MAKKPTNVVEFKRKPKLSKQVKNLLDSMPGYKAELERILRRLPEDVKIGAMEEVVQIQYLGKKLPPELTEMLADITAELNTSGEYDD